MKGIVANLILIFLPFILFIAAFYLTASLLSKEHEISDLSSKVLRIINEAEIYKNIIKEKVKAEKQSFILKGQYLNFKVNILKIENNEIEYEIIAEPIEKIFGIDLILHLIDKVKL